MRITDITTTPLAIGKGLLRIHTDAGVEGWAESPGHNPAGTGRQAAGALSASDSRRHSKTFISMKKKATSHRKASQTSTNSPFRPQ